MAQTPRSQSELEGLESSLRVPSIILAPHLKMLSARAHVTEQGFLCKQDLCKTHNRPKARSVTSIRPERSERLDEIILHFHARSHTHCMKTLQAHAQCSPRKPCCVRVEVYTIMDATLPSQMCPKRIILQLSLRQQTATKFLINALCIVTLVSSFARETP